MTVWVTEGLVRTLNNGANDMVKGDLTAGKRKRLTRIAAVEEARMGNTTSSRSLCRQKAEAVSLLIRAGGQPKKEAHEVGMNRKEQSIFLVRMGKPHSLLLPSSM